MSEMRDMFGSGLTDAQWDRRARLWAIGAEPATSLSRLEVLEAWVQDGGPPPEGTEAALRRLEGRRR